MIRQYLPNNSKTTTVAFRQKFCQLNSPLAMCLEPDDLSSLHLSFWAAIHACQVQVSSGCGL
jgi:hypothetical protein